MSYATPNDLRRLIGLSTISTDPDYKTDSDLQWYLNKACTLILEDFSIQRQYESMNGNIDGSNTTFEISYTPISDIDFDSTVNANDVTVFTYGDTDDPTTRTTVSVSTVYPYEGKIVLSSAPASTIEDVQCTYRYYLSDTIRFDLLPLANAYMAGFLFLTNEFLMVPDQYAVGALRYKHKVMPYSQVLNHYYTVMNLIKTKHWSKKEHSDLELIRGI